MWAHSDVLDNGLTYLKTSAIKQLLISSYTNGDTYATVLANKMAEVSIAPSEWVIANGGNGARQVTSPAGKVAAATVGASGPVPPATKIDLFWAFTDGTSKVLWVTNATSDTAIVVGTSYTFPALTYTSNQPQLA